jgi:hypothetical protein
MPYVKIYPKKISATSSDTIIYLGRVVYDVEQYGNLIQNNFFEISISKLEKTQNTWLISSIKEQPDIKNFDAFLRALNFYFFRNLKFEVPIVDNLSPAQNFEVDLREVYFSLDSDTNQRTPRYHWNKLEDKN